MDVCRCSLQIILQLFLLQEHLFLSSLGSILLFFDVTEALDFPITLSDSSLQLKDSLGVLLGNGVELVDSSFVSESLVLRLVYSVSLQSLNFTCQTLDLFSHLLYNGIVPAVHLLF